MAELTKDRNDRGQKWVCRSDLGRRLVTRRSQMHAIINSGSSGSSGSGGSSRSSSSSSSS